MKMNSIYPNYINIINFVYLGRIVVAMHQKRDCKIVNDSNDGRYNYFVGLNDLCKNTFKGISHRKSIDLI